MRKCVIHFDLSAVNSFAPLKQTFVQNFALYCVIFFFGGGGEDKEIFQVSFKMNLVIGGSVPTDSHWLILWACCFICMIFLFLFLLDWLSEWSLEPK